MAFSRSIPVRAPRLYLEVLEQHGEGDAMIPARQAKSVHLRREQSLILWTAALQEPRTMLVYEQLPAEVRLEELSEGRLAPLKMHEEVGVVLGVKIGSLQEHV